MKDPGKDSRADALAEIQARLEMCEADLETDRRMSDVSEETQEIERMLEALMTDEAPEADSPLEKDLSGGQVHSNAGPAGAPAAEDLLLEEDAAAATLAESEEARRGQARNKA